MKETYYTRISSDFDERVISRSITVIVIAKTNWGAQDRPLWYWKQYRRDGDFVTSFSFYSAPGDKAFKKVSEAEAKASRGQSG